MSEFMMQSNSEVLFSRATRTMDETSGVPAAFRRISGTSLI
jgi:hypothetical protein